jgi:hypothetical protein
MINREEKLNPSVSGGSDLNQDLVENSDYTKSTPESEMMNNDGIESSGMNRGESMLTGGGTSTPDSTSMMGENSDEDYDKEDTEGGNSIGNYSNDDSYKTSDTDREMEDENNNQSNQNYQPTQMKNKSTESDMPYDVPNDQTPPMHDMPRNYEQYSKYETQNESAVE